MWGWVQWGRCEGKGGRKKNSLSPFFSISTFVQKKPFHHFKHLNGSYLILNLISILQNSNKKEITIDSKLEVNLSLLALLFMGHSSIISKPLLTRCQQYMLSFEVEKQNQGHQKSTFTPFTTSISPFYCIHVTHL